MASTPTRGPAKVQPSATPPSDLVGDDLTTWYWALKVMKEQETFELEQLPFLNEYVYALREARETRQEAESQPFVTSKQDVVSAHPGFVVSDRATKRAAMLAEMLVLTSLSQASLYADDDEDTPENPYSKLDGVPADELAARRSG